MILNFIGDEFRINTYLLCSEHVLIDWRQEYVRNRDGERMTKKMIDTCKIAFSISSKLVIACRQWLLLPVGGAFVPIGFDFNTELYWTVCTAGMCGKNCSIYLCIYIPNRSLTPANVITSDATNKSAMANDAKNKFPIRRKLRSVYIAKHTKIFPAMDKNIKRDKNTPAKRTRRKQSVHWMKLEWQSIRAYLQLYQKYIEWRTLVIDRHLLKTRTDLHTHNFIITATNRWLIRTHTKYRNQRHKFNAIFQINTWGKEVETQLKSPTTIDKFLISFYWLHPITSCLLLECKRTRARARPRCDGSIIWMAQHGRWIDGLAGNQCAFIKATIYNWWFETIN